MVPGGLRLGTPALTTRGFVEADFETRRGFRRQRHRHRQDAEGDARPEAEGFQGGARGCAPGKFPEIDALRDQVEAFAAQFPTIGFDKKEGKYTQSCERARRDDDDGKKGVSAGGEEGGEE